MNIHTDFGDTDIKTGQRKLSYNISYKKKVCRGCGEWVPPKTKYVSTYNSHFTWTLDVRYCLCVECGEKVASEHNVEIDMNVYAFESFELMERLKDKGVTNERVSKNTKL